MIENIELKQHAYDSIRGCIYARNAKKITDDSNGEETYITHEDDRALNKCMAMRLSNGNYLYLTNIGTGIFEYSFYDAFGAHIFTGTTSKVQNIDEAINYVLEQYDLNYEKPQIIDVDNFKSAIQTKNQIEKF